MSDRQPSDYDVEAMRRDCDHARERYWPGLYAYRVLVARGRPEGAVYHQFDDVYTVGSRALRTFLSRLLSAPEPR